jgi:hypothetical protein
MPVNIATTAEIPLPGKKFPRNYKIPNSGFCKICNGNRGATSCHLTFDLYFISDVFIEKNAVSS